MIDRNEIDAEIAVLENSSKTSYGVCEKLSILYSVRDHLGQTEAPRSKPYPLYSYASEPSENSQTEFGAVARSADPEVLLEVLSEHMEAIKLLHPKEYQSVIRKLKN